MARLEEDINSEILGWARERAGLSLEKAAKKIGLSSQNLAKMEDGERKPTRKQLFTIAKTYWYPLTVFYASHPPLPTKGGVDFRNSKLITSTTAEERGRLDALVRDIYARQSIVRSVLEDDEDEEPRSFVGSQKNTDNISASVTALKKILNLSDNKVLNFSELRERVQSIGVFVLLVGDLGSHHTKTHETIFRGLAIADRIAPFIVINPYDAETARSFTLIHELTHVMIGNSGISGEVTIDDQHTENGKIEKFCNDVASNTLLPDKSLSGIKMLDDEATARKVIANLTRQHKVSHSMVAYRLFSKNSITEKMYNDLCQFYKNMWKNKKEQERQARKEKESGGPSSYVIKRQRIGNLLINFVRQSLNAHDITYTKAANLLGVDAASVRILIEPKNK